MWTITINPHCLLLESIWITIRLPFEFISTRFARDCSRVGRQENIWKTSAKLEHHLRSTAAELRTGKRVPLESQMAGWASATFNTCFNPNEADLPTSEAASEVTSGLFCGEASTDRCELCLSTIRSISNSLWFESPWTPWWNPQEICWVMEDPMVGSPGVVPGVLFHGLGQLLGQRLHSGALLQVPPSRAVARWELLVEINSTCGDFSIDAIQ